MKGYKIGPHGSSISLPAFQEMVSYKEQAVAEIHTDTENPVGRTAMCYLFTQLNGLSWNQHTAPFLLRCLQKEPKEQGFNDAINRIGVIFILSRYFCTEDHHNKHKQPAVLLRNPQESYLLGVH